MFLAMAMLRFVAILTAMLLLVPRAPAQETEWLNDWNEAFRVAKRQRKLVFVDFRAEWCAPCRMMEKSVFPTAEVQERLREYVLLRVDVDRAPGLMPRAPSLPTFVVYDAQERERFRFTGGTIASTFVKRLDVIRHGMPFMLEAAELFAQKKDVEAWTQVARGYTKTRAAGQAREAWQRVERAAASRGDRPTSQAAALNAAFTWVMEGQTAKAIGLLKKIADKPVNRETQGLTWVLLGQAYIIAKDAVRGREAFEKARALVPADHPVAREATAALATLQ